MKALTLRQQQIYDLVRIYISQVGIPPTRAEIASSLGFRSPNTAEEHLKALARKGVIEIIAGVSRGIRLLKEQNKNKWLPLIHLVAIEELLFAKEHMTSTYYQIDKNIFSPSADFLLRIDGFSMKNIGILNGDLLAIHKTKIINNNQIIVAKINEKWIIHFFQKNNQTIEFITKQTQQTQSKSKIFNFIKQDYSIEGLVVGLIRSNFFPLQ